MKWTMEDFNRFFQCIKPRVLRWIRRETQNTLQTVPATIITSDATSPTVRLFTGETDGSEDFAVSNPYSFALTAGQVVRLFYWETLTNAFVGLPNEVVS